MLNLKVDDKDLQKRLKLISKTVGKTAEDSVIDLAKMGSKQIANNVQPFGLSNRSKDILEKAVYKDISKTYWDTGRTYTAIKKIKPKLAAAYAKAMNDGDTSKAEAIAKKVITGFRVAPIGSGTHLESSRNRKGRVVEAEPQGIANTGDLEQLKAKKVLTAGTAKAGFLQAGKSLGAKGKITAWLDKSDRLGSSNVVRNGWNTVVTIYNHVKYASSVISDSQIQNAINTAYRNNLKTLQKKLDALMRKQ